MRKLNQFITRVEIVLCEVLLVVLTVLVFGAAVMRKFGVSTVWTQDMATFLFVWVCFIGADVALIGNKHMGMDILLRKMPKALERVVLFVVYMMVIAFLVVVAVFGVYLAIVNHDRQFQSMEFSYSWATVSAPLGCALMIRTAVRKLIHLATGKAPAGTTESSAATEPEGGKP
jgi:TRAP-type C4-dicarboxylate transport system permease small subunit